MQGVNGVKGMGTSRFTPFFNLPGRQDGGEAADLVAPEGGFLVSLGGDGSAETELGVGEFALEVVRGGVGERPHGRDRKGKCGGRGGKILNGAGGAKGNFSDLKIANLGQINSGGPAAMGAGVLGKHGGSKAFFPAKAKLETAVKAAEEIRAGAGQAARWSICDAARKG